MRFGRTMYQKHQSQVSDESCCPSSKIPSYEPKQKIGDRSITNLKSEEKFIVIVTEHSFQQFVSEEPKDIWSERISKLMRMREFGTVEECLECIKNEVKPCGRRYLCTTEFGQSEFETASIEICRERGGNIICSSETIDFWSMDLAEIFSQINYTSSNVLQT
mmetsp:Transcript_40276/g.53032  ORF Transcript_40276/g.53032 Transcript_40276/m.53032 type:complete len:162 (+) Transcript_40276:209-694(+)